MYDKKDVLKINLSQVVQALGIALEERAGYYTALCPFHNDKNDSFIVYDNLKKPIQGIWQCYTCGIQGDSIDLVIREKKLSFSEAVDWIGETFELTKQALTPQQAQMFAMKAKIIPVLHEANEWFFEQKNEWFFEYLDKRGFSGQSITKWEFGYAPNNVIDLKKHLYDKGFSDEQLVGSGLFKMKASGIEPIHYGRLMIPLKDKTGNIVGFAGRTQSELNTTTKYITTTASFTKKRAITYGLSEVRKEKVSRLFITEGNLDTPKVLQNTNEFAVSVMGTGITREHIKDISASLPDLRAIIIALDGDDAGRNGTKKFVDKVYSAEDFYFKNKFDFYVFPTPDGMDLDSLITDDIDLFYDLRKELVHVIDFTMIELRKDYDRDSKTENDKYVSKCLEIIASVEQFRTKDFIESLSELSGYATERLNKELYVYKIRHRNITKELYEKKLLKFIVNNRKETLGEIGVPVDRILSPKGVSVLNEDWSKYATKLYFMSISEVEDVSRDEAILYGLLLLATNYYEIIIEYDSLNSSNKLRINTNTSNSIVKIQDSYDIVMKDVVRRIDEHR